jgi:hypothetical protein
MVAPARIARAVAALAAVAAVITAGAVLIGGAMALGEDGLDDPAVVLLNGERAAAPSPEDIEAKGLFEVAISLPVSSPRGGPTVKAAAAGENWTTLVHAVGDDRRVRITTWCAENETSVLLVAWAEGHCPEVLELELTPKDIRRGVVRAKSTELRRQCELRVGISEVSAWPIAATVIGRDESISTGEAAPRGVKGNLSPLKATLTVPGSRGWQLAPGTLDDLFSNDGEVLPSLRDAAKAGPAIQPLDLSRRAAVIDGLPEGAAVSVDIEGASLTLKGHELKLASPRTRLDLRARYESVLSVSVRDARGGLVEEAAISIYRFSELGRDSGFALPLLNGFTSRGGKWYVAAPVDDDVWVVATFGENWDQVASGRIRCVKGNNELVLAPGNEETVSGRVVDDTGAGVERFCVRLGNDQWGFEAQVQTDERGNFSAQIPRIIPKAFVNMSGSSSRGCTTHRYTAQSRNAHHNHEVAVPSAGHMFTVERKPIEELPGTLELSFNLPPSRENLRRLDVRGECRRIHGTFLDAARIMPVSFQMDVPGGSIVLEPGIYTLRAQPSNIGNPVLSRYERFEIKGEQTTRVTMTLETCAEFAVRLVDDSGEPIRGARLALNGMISRDALRATDADGLARFGMQAPGPQTISVIRSSWYAGQSNEAQVTHTLDGKPPVIRAQAAPEQIRIMNTDDADVSFWVQSSLDGFSNHQPISTTEDSATFQGLPPGTYFLTAGDPRVQESRVGLRVEIASFTEERLFELRDGKIHEIER